MVEENFTELHHRLGSLLQTALYRLKCEKMIFAQRNMHFTFRNIYAFIFIKRITELQFGSHTVSGFNDNRYQNGRTGKDWKSSAVVPSDYVAVNLKETNFIRDGLHDSSAELFYLIAFTNPLLISTGNG